MFNIFSFKGRINRKNYALWSVLVMLISLLKLWNVMEIAAYYTVHYNNTNIYYIMVSRTVFVLFILEAILMFSLTIKRLHDIDIPGYASIFLLIPVLNLVFYIILLAMKSDGEPNRYGEVPSK